MLGVPARVGTEEAAQSQVDDAHRGARLVPGETAAGGSRQPRRGHERRVSYLARRRNHRSLAAPGPDGAGEAGAGAGTGTGAGEAAQIGGPDAVLSAGEIEAFIGDRLAAAGLDGRSVCVLVPDGTRSCPLPLLLRAVHRALHGRVSRADGPRRARHARRDERAGARRAPRLAARRPSRALSGDDRAESRLVGRDDLRPRRDHRCRPGRRAVRWHAASSGASVRINRAVVEHDVTLIVGPVFPHEVVGFSGGNKYLFPGVSGRELIDLSHWLGALITSADDHRHPRDHAGAGAHRRGRVAGPRRAAGVLRRHQVRARPDLHCA